MQRELDEARGRQENMNIFTTAQKSSLEMHVKKLTEGLAELSTEQGALLQSIHRKNKRSHESKTQLLAHQRMDLDAQTPPSAKPWSISGLALRDGSGGMKYEIYRKNLTDGADTREQDEFNFAFAQMLRLFGCQAEGKQIPQIERVVVYEVPLVATVYASKKQAMLGRQSHPGQDCRELWVFHGTAEKNIEAIMTTGFKVGGEGLIPIANGDAHGRGIYTASGPDTPMDYSQRGGRTKAVILSKMLEGTKGVKERGDCWASKGDWLICKTGEQLLPKYVICWK